MKETVVDKKSEAPTKGFGDTVYQSFNVADPATGTLPKLMENIQGNESTNAEKIDVEEHQGVIIKW